MRNSRAVGSKRLRDGSDASAAAGSGRLRPGPELVAGAGGWAAPCASAAPGAARPSRATRRDGESAHTGLPATA